jgi:hypothetical protein
MNGRDLRTVRESANGRYWRFAASRDSAFQVHVPPNHGLQGDTPRAAHA